MGSRSAIEWTDATWNPIRGCSRVSEGCRNCYAERIAARFSGPGLPYEGVAKVVAPRDSLDRVGGRRDGWTGEVRFIEEHLRDPLRWRKPRRIFVNSMSDLFHERVPIEWVDRIFMVMADAQQHTYQILTKRPERMRAYMLGWGLVRGALPNIWLGVSIEDQASADVRVPHLLNTPAAVRFVSAEPLLGALNIACYLGPCTVCGGLGCDQGTPLWPCAHGVDWVIAGGESGPGARPMHPDAASALRDQCVAARVPFFFKQWGEWAPGGRAPVPAGEDPHDRVEARMLDELPSSAGAPFVYRLGKRRAGRLLDGREWNEMPRERREVNHG